MSSARTRFLIDAYDIAGQRSWSDKTFGRGERLKGVLAHIRKELVEIEEHPTDESEWADLLILAIDGATRQGILASELIEAYHAKMKENRHREWPPIPEDGFPEDEAVEHVREVVTSEDGKVTTDTSYGISTDEDDEIRRLWGGCR